MRTIHLTKGFAAVSLGLLFAGNAGGCIKAGEIKACEKAYGKLTVYCNKSEDG